jgi:hypothetical protein
MAASSGLESVLGIRVFRAAFRGMWMHGLAVEQTALR